MMREWKHNRNRNQWKRACAAAMLSVMAATSAAGAFPVLAAEPKGVVSADPKAALNTAKGVTDFGRGDAGVSIYGNPGQTLVGKKFAVYQLFYAENSRGGESINYTFHPQYKKPLQTVVGKRLGKAAVAVTEYEVIDYLQTMNRNPVEGTNTEQTPEGTYSDYRYFIEELRGEIVKEGIAGDQVNVTSVRSDNSIFIGGLAYGYYVVDEISMVEGTHSAASLCMVSTANPRAEINIKSDYPSVVKKIREDDDQKGVGNEGWNDMADFEIGQTVPYRFISNVPDMNGYDTYYYAWHDVMDEALTFRPESVKITIRDKKLDRTYQLQKSEFSVVTEPGGGETFQVRIKDLKAIVDRRFDQMNHLGENVYGQEVELRYDATLNDKASQDTGRPGFENDVKLEFSNNPDADGEGETGETPWDTVVCFTYKLNGLKINNHDMKLEGAKFRLYSDEACKNEVYVKKAADGYHVINRDSAGGSDHTGGTVPAGAVEMVSQKDGVFTIIGLDGGTYWLKETDAPDGYRPILDPIRLDVRPEFVKDRNTYVKGQGATDQALKALKMSAYVKQFLDGGYEENTEPLETDVQEGSGNLTVINTVGKKLPVTGSSMMLLMLGAGTVMMTYGVRGFRQRKEEENGENGKEA